MKYEHREKLKEYIENNPEIRLLIAGDYFDELWEYVFEEDSYYDWTRDGKLIRWLMIQGLTEAGIDIRLKEIPDYAFSYTAGLPERVVIPTGVKKIGRLAFCNTFGVKDIIVPNSVDEIDDAAFAQVYDLQSITLPKKFKGQAVRLGLRGKSKSIKWV